MPKLTDNEKKILSAYFYFYEIPFAEDNWRYDKLLALLYLFKDSNIFDSGEDNWSFNPYTGYIDNSDCDKISHRLERIISRQEIKEYYDSNEFLETLTVEETHKVISARYKLLIGIKQAEGDETFAKWLEILTAIKSFGYQNTYAAMRGLRLMGDD